MAKKIKKYNVRKKKLSSWKILWSSLGFYTVVMALLTSGYILTVQKPDVLAATSGPGTSNPCQYTRCGTGPYCSGRCGVAGKVSDNYLYYCQCPRNNTHCKNAYIQIPDNSHTCKPQGCYYNRSGQDRCIKPSSGTTNKGSSPKIALNDFTFTCTPPTIHISWTPSGFSSPPYLVVKISDLYQKDKNGQNEVLDTIIPSGNNLNLPFKSSVKIKSGDYILVEIFDSKGSPLAGLDGKYTCK